MRCTAFGVLFLISSASLGNAQQASKVTITEPGSATLDSYMKKADIVALVKVIAGDSEAYGVPIYKAQVRENFKGTSVGQTIFFGRFVGTRLGWEYLLFLRNAANPISPKSSANPSFGPVRYAEVFNEGYSSMETSYECIFGAEKECDYGIRVCTDYVILPTNTPVSPPMTETTDFGCRWVRRKTMLSLLAEQPSSQQP